jgi:6-phosphogluconate dehydrogenase
MAHENEFGIIGLGKMGGGLAHHALEKSIRVVGASRSGAPRDLVEAGLVEIADIGGFRAQLRPPRAVLLYIPAGNATDTVLENLGRALEPGDTVVDGGNSYWGDSIRRHQLLREKGLHFVDAGTSGGLRGARHGACFMVGGERDAVARIESLLRTLSENRNSFVHAGPPGAGHFVKLVHNGIEFGMLQAIAEGFDLLTHYHEKLDIGTVLECWGKGSVIRSWLVDLLSNAYNADSSLKKASSYIEDTGEVNWLVADALRMEVPVPVIAQSVMQLFASRDERKTWARAIVMMRHGFGGHPFGPEESIARERRRGRVGDIFRPSDASGGNQK